MNCKKIIIKSAKQSFLFSFIVVASLFFNVHCGSSAISTSSTPPIDIPSPISHLSISSPDANGIVHIVGEAGFADAGSSITITVTSSTSSNLNWLINTAWAQTITTATAAADGSFSADVAVAAASTIAISYTTNGTQTSATAEVPASQPSIDSAATLFDISVNANTAMLVGNDGVDGFVYLLNLTTLEVDDTITLTGASGASRISVDQTTGDALVVDNANTQIWLVDTALLTATPQTVLIPYDVAFLESGNFAIITHQDSIVASYFNTTTQNPDDSVEATADNLASAEMATLVDADTDALSQDVFALLATMADNSINLISYLVSASTVTQQTATVLTGLSSAGGLALFDDGQKALVTDSDNNTVMLINLTTDDITTIEVGADPRGVVVSDQQGKAYVVNNGDRTVSIIDLSDDSVSLDSQALGLNPTVINLDRSVSDSAAVIVNQGDGSTSILN